MRGAAFPTKMDRYIARLLVRPLAVVLVLSALILLLDKLRRLLDFVVNAGGSPRVVFSMLANIVPTYLSFGVVVGLMLSIVLTFRKLATTSELDVLRACGVSYARMLIVPLCFAVTLCAVNFALIGFVQPHARYAYKEIAFDLQSGALGISIKKGEFNRVGKQSTLWIGNIDGNRLEDVFIRMAGRKHPVTISAAEARILAAPDGKALLFRLRRGVLIEEQQDLSSPRVLTFDSYDLRVAMPSIGRMLERGGDADEMTVVELARIAQGDRSVGADHSVTPRVAAANLHFRLVQVATLLVLPFLGLALAVPPKRTTSPVGIFVSIIVLVLWYKLNQFTLAQAAAGAIPPFWGQWMPFALFAGASGWFYYSFSHGIGGRPLGMLETAWSKLVRIWRRKLKPA